LSGKIIDSATRQSVVGASIFLSKTTIGTTSNEKGEFIIQDIPKGKYELVISSFNYHTFITTIESSNLKDLTIILSPSANVLKEVIVEAYDKNGWEKWGDYFNTNFIGTSGIIKYCKLINPDVVKFRYSNKTNTLIAFAHEKLVFENNALGYKIHYVLTKFQVDFKAGTFLYKGYPLFENLAPKDSIQQIKWDSARANIYRGSLMHFMRCLYNNQILEAGFEVRSIFMVSEEEKKRVNILYRKIQEMEEKGTIIRPFMDKDSLDYYTKVWKIKDNDRVLLNKLLPADKLVIPSGSVDAVLLYFEGKLNVRYIRKKEPHEYSRMLMKKPDTDLIASELSLIAEQSIKVYKNGQYFSGENLLTEGFWAWSEKLSTLLPSDYWPAGTNK